MNSTHRILFVDDDVNLLAAFQRNLRRHFALETAVGAAEALEILRKDPGYAVIVADMRMPVMDGIEFLEQARALAPDSVRIMLTGNADQQTPVDAVNRGEVYRFLNKPCPPDALMPVLENALQHYETKRIERELLEGTLTGSVKMLSEVLGMVAPHALGRGQRLRESMRRFAEAAGAGPLWELEIAALLSPVGYASLPSRVLQKLGTGDELSDAEQGLLRRMPETGYALLADIPRLAGVARIVLYQNKSFDGGGFPDDEWAGDDIPIGARMLKILGDRMVLESDGIVKRRALEMMQGCPGVYDPKLLAVCFECLPDFLVQTVSAAVPVRALRVSELSVGQVVVTNVTTPTGAVIVGSGNRLTTMTLDHLRHHFDLGEVKEPVLVQDDPSKTKPEEPAAPAHQTA